MLFPGFNEAPLLIGLPSPQSTVHVPIILGELMFNVKFPPLQSYQYGLLLGLPKKSFNCGHWANKLPVKSMNVPIIQYFTTLFLHLYVLSI